MADLAELTGAGRIDIFDGYRLSPPDMLDMGECEKEFEAKHIAFARVAAGGQHPEAAEKILNKARADIAAGMFAFGTSYFDAQALMAQNLPLWIYLELRRHHPDMTKEKAAELLRQHPDPFLVQDVVMGIAGYSFDKKKPTTDPETSPPTGTPSSPPSASAASPTPTSEASPSTNSATPSASGEAPAAPPAPQ